MGSCALNRSKYFTRIGYLSLSRSKNGLFYPVFRLGNLNNSFVQEVNRHGCVEQFVEFEDFDHFQFVAVYEERFLTVGDSALYAFFGEDGQLVEVDQVGFAKDVRTSAIKISEINVGRMTALGLARLAGLPAHEIAEFQSKYLAKCGFGPNRMRLLEHASLRASRMMEAWWDEAAYLEFGDKRVAQELGHADTEEIIEWLFEHSVDAEWKNVFLLVSRKVPLDDRLIDLVLRFIEDDLRIYEPKKIDFTIFCRGLELFTYQDEVNREFVDAIFEMILDGSFFEMREGLSSNVIPKFLSDFVRARQSFDDTRAVVDSVIDYFESDEIGPMMALPLLTFIMSTDAITDRYPDNSPYSDLSRLDRVQELFWSHSRFALAVGEEGREQHGFLEFPPDDDEDDYGFQ